MYYTELSYSEILGFFWSMFGILWTLTLVRSMWGKYSDERCWNSGVCSVFCNSLMTIVTFLAKTLNPEAVVLKIRLPTISQENSLMYVVVLICALPWVFKGILLPLYRAFIESDGAKDKRFGTVPIKED